MKNETSNIVKSFDGKNFYPMMVIKTTEKSARVQRVNHAGKAIGEAKTCRFSKYYSDRVVNFDRGLTVYLDEPMTLEAATEEFYSQNLKMNKAA